MFAVHVRRICGAFLGALAGVGVALGVAACGHTAHARAGQRIGIAEMEYRLRPDHIVAASGHRLSISVHNFGRLTHNLVIARTTPTTTVLTRSDTTVTETTTVAARTPDLAPGQGTTLTVTLAPGRYRLASTLVTDLPLGEQGTLTVLSK